MAQPGKALIYNNMTLIYNNMTLISGSILRRSALPPLGRPIFGTYTQNNLFMCQTSVGRCIRNKAKIIFQIPQNVDPPAGAGSLSSKTILKIL